MARVTYAQEDILACVHSILLAQAKEGCREICRVMPSMLGVKRDSDLCGSVHAIAGTRCSMGLHQHELCIGVSMGSAWLRLGLCGGPFSKIAYFTACKKTIDASFIAGPFF